MSAAGGAAGAGHDGEGPQPPYAAGAGLVHWLAPLLRDWLPRQRWFAGKGSAITGFGLISAVELLPADERTGLPGLLHLLLDVDQADGSCDCYQLLLGTGAGIDAGAATGAAAGAGLPPALAPAAIGRMPAGPLAGQTVYEALHDPRLAGVLLDRLRAPGRTGPLRFSAEPGETVRADLAPRLSSAEQSNSSVVYGDAFILKVFRRISAGTNPDLEVSLALAHAGCERVPAPAAWFEALGLHDEPATLGVLQHFMSGAADGWGLALRSVDAACGRTAAPGDPADFTAHARALGGATAEVHTALAGALPHEVLDRAQIGLLATAMADRLTAAVRAVPELVPYERALRGAYTELAEAGEHGEEFAVQRIHGDLHLGQALHTEDQGWVLIDFEGEPARPLSERRRPQPVAQDIAGMLRSFDYAARHRDPGSAGAAAWAERQRTAFCDGYAERSGRDPRSMPVMLRAYETDKAVYEVLYEARHRPGWLPIPMAAVQRLAVTRPAA